MVQSAMRKLYEEGATLTEVAERFGIDRRTVSRRIRKSGGKIRSRSKRASGTKNSQWRGGHRRTKDGYVLIYVGVQKYVLEHRMVMERKLGRKLEPHEIVHHINEIRDDNRPENLKLVTTTSHRTEHIISTWSRAYDCCQRCGTTARKHAGKGLCTRCRQHNYTVAKRGHEAKRDENGKLIFSNSHCRLLSKAAKRREDKRRAHGTNSGKSSSNVVAGTR